MTAGTVETILARCVMEPDFLDALRDDPAHALPQHEIDDSARQAFLRIDVDKLRRFGGFIARVQHNHLWESFPGTRHLLRFYGIEADVFTAFRPLQLAHDAPATSDERIRMFVHFVDELLRTSFPRRCRGARSVLQHEAAVWELRAAAKRFQWPEPTQPLDVRRLSWNAFRRLVPLPTGPMRCGTYAVNPLDIHEQIASGTFDGRHFKRGLTLLYWIDPSSTAIRMLRVNALYAVIAAHANGRRSVRAIIDMARRDGADAPPMAFRPLFETAARVGLLSFQTSQSCE